MLPFPFLGSYLINLIIHVLCFKLFQVIFGNGLNLKFQKNEIINHKLGVTLSTLLIFSEIKGCRYLIVLSLH